MSVESLKEMLRRTRVFSFILALTILGGLGQTLHAAQFPVTVTDDRGKEVTIYRRPKRIISLSPANTEILFALGLDEEIVGVTEFCNYPPEAKGKEKIGGYSNPNLEKIVSLKPDLILADYGNPIKGIKQIESLGYTLVGLNPKTIEDILRNIKLVGKITGKTKEASELISNMKERLKSVEERVRNLDEDEKVRVLYVIWYKPLWTAGSGTFIDELIKKAGGINIASELSGYKQMSLEKVIEKNPQVIVVGESKDQPNLVKTVKEETTLSGTDAFRNNRIYTIDTDIVSRSGPRIVDALEQLAKLLHPKMFKEAK